MKSVRSSVVTILVVMFSLGVSGPLSADEVVASGTFVGKSNHKTSGNVETIKTSDGYVAKLASNFSLDGAPDPKLAFATNGKSLAIFSILERNNGEQTYAIPASIAVDQFNEFYIWCEKYSVPLGLAKLK